MCLATPAHSIQSIRVSTSESATSESGAGARRGAPRGRRAGAAGGTGVAWASVDRREGGAAREGGRWGGREGGVEGGREGEETGEGGGGKGRREGGREGGREMGRERDGNREAGKSGGGAEGLACCCQAPGTVISATPPRQQRAAAKLPGIVRDDDIMRGVSTAHLTPSLISPPDFQGGSLGVR